MLYIRVTDLDTTTVRLEISVPDDVDAGVLSAEIEAAVGNAHSKVLVSIEAAPFAMRRMTADELVASNPLLSREAAEPSQR